MALQGTKTRTSTLGRLLGQGGSDHAKQGAEFREGTLVLRGLTHNMLNQGHDIDHCPVTGKIFSNNPYNIQESKEDYLLRKEKQLNSYIKDIQDAYDAYKPLDFIFLQEVDVFRNTQLDVEKEKLLNAFKGKLNALNWGFTIPRQDLDCKPLVTLYNKNTFTKFYSLNGLMKDLRKTKNTAFETVFHHHKSGKKIALTNVHLDYNKDPMDCYNDILEYQRAQIQKGILTIIGGDTNHPREAFQGLALGDSQFPTSFDLDENTNTLSRRHRLTGYQNAIDSFFVSPSSNKSVVTGCQILSEYVDENYQFKHIPQAQLHFYHSSEPGKPARSTEQVPVRRHESVSRYASSFASHSAQDNFTNPDTNQQDNVSTSKEYNDLCNSMKEINRVLSSLDNASSTSSSSSNGLFLSSPRAAVSSTSTNAISYEQYREKISHACVYLSNNINLTKYFVRFDQVTDTYVVALKHNSLRSNVGMNPLDANTELKFLATRLNDHKIRPENGTYFEIKDYSFNDKKYRCIYLSKIQALELSKMYETHSLKKSLNKRR